MTTAPNTLSQLIGQTPAPLTLPTAPLHHSDEPVGQPESEKRVSVAEISVAACSSALHAIQSMLLHRH